MRKIVWISFISALVIVNLLAFAADRFGGVYIAMPYRLAVVLSITLISCVFGGAWVLMNQADEEVPSNQKPQQPQPEKRDP
ncbi:hypothetical protein [Pseudohongiella sp.]|uniref:Uncharacterized protein n=1 Tax=marine sediment metagenome TaxID=412755 RepID=A0A0F9YK23_9ZZZZ|nr:hypothetical protein [Pseudohongiella sp.]HDZ09680.1 hypothetical protein [Pseudohongiella sp.]HEA61869.1 hypothetical protein [Pseudohongiella sp.]